VRLIKLSFTPSFKAHYNYNFTLL